MEAMQGEKRRSNRQKHGMVQQRTNNSRILTNLYMSDQLALSPKEAGNTKRETNA